MDEDSGNCDALQYRKRVYLGNVVGLINMTANSMMILGLGTIVTLRIETPE